MGIITKFRLLCVIPFITLESEYFNFLNELPWLCATPIGVECFRGHRFVPDFGLSCGAVGLFVKVCLL